MTSFIQPGHVLAGRYEIENEIGRGGFSVVYAAEDRVVDQRVAVKLLVPPPAVAEKARERMRREVLAVRSLNHPHIVTLYDFLNEGPWSFVVMELVEGGNLHEYVTARGPLADADLRRIGAALAEALSGAHRNGILHRDVKPQNVLMTRDGRALLSDFGSARIEGESTLTVTGQQVGTLHTMAPELLRGKRADGRADIYSLGMTLYFAATGEFPDAAGPLSPPTPRTGGFAPRARRPEISSALDAGIAQSTREDPSARFPTAEAFAQALLGEYAADAVDTPLLSDVGRWDVCLMCGGGDPLSLGVCPGCEGSSAVAGDSMLLVAEADGLTRHELRTRLEALAAGRGPAGPVVCGERALVRTDPDTADRLVALLCARGLRVRSLPCKEAWRALPRSLQLLLAANIAAGAGLALSSGLDLLAAGVGCALLVGTLAQRRLTHPWIGGTPLRSSLPLPIEARVRQAFGTLTPGVAHGLLSDVVRIANGLCAGFSEHGGTPALSGRVGDLVLASCDVATELQTIDGALGTLEAQRARRASLPEGWSERVSRVERARDALVHRLLEALGALGATRSDATEDEGGAAVRLGTFTEELESERRIQAEATKELEAFLAA